jgi:hypothetical protein
MRDVDGGPLSAPLLTEPNVAVAAAAVFGVDRAIGCGVVVAATILGERNDLHGESMPTTTIVVRQKLQCM